MNRPSNSDMIDAIHASNLYGIIIECGAGTTISSALYEVEGASNTIYYSLQPYSKEYQRYIYGDSKYFRSVSYEFLHQVFVHTLDSISDDIDPPVNFILGTTFQIKSTKGNELTHGWIGLQKIEKHMGVVDRTTMFYHLSIPESFYNRVEYFKIIRNIGIDLLYAQVNPDFRFQSKYIDNIVTTNCRGEVINEDRDRLQLIQNIASIEQSHNDGYLFFDEDGKVKRMEDFCRGAAGLILVKGSFNPLHQRHMALMKESRKLYPSYRSAFFISVGNRDKKEIDAEELYSRIKNIQNFGYAVVLCKNPMFIDNTNWIHQRFPSLPIIFPVGYDTINRFVSDCITEINKDGSGHFALFYSENGYDDYFEFHKLTNIKFLIFHRKDIVLDEKVKNFLPIIQFDEKSIDEDGISSTKIRNGEIKNEL